MSNFSITVTSHSVPARDEQLARVEITLLGTILTLALLGNGVLAVVLRRISVRRKLTRMNRMMAHLTAADIFVAVCHVLPQMAWKITLRFRGGNVLCKLVAYVQVVAMFAAAYVLVATAIDRYIAVCHPLKTPVWNGRRMHMLVAALWLASLAFSVPQMFVFAERPWDWALTAYITWVTLAIYVVPLIALVSVYTRICIAVWRSEKFNRTASRIPRTPASDADRLPCRTPSSQQQQQATASTSVSTAKLKTVKLTLVVVISYVVCYGPFFVAQMWAAWDLDAPFQEKPMVIIMLLASLNSCVNPWIYLSFNDHVTLRCRRRPKLGHKNSNSTAAGETRATAATRTSQQGGAGAPRPVPAGARSTSLQLRSKPDAVDTSASSR